MLHYLAAWLPMAPGDPTPVPTATVTVTVPPAAPSPAATMPGWASTGAQQAMQVSGNVGINQDAIYGALYFVAGLLMAAMAFKMLAGASKGDVKLAGRQSAVAGIGSFWLGVALMIGAVPVLGLGVNLIRSAITV